MSRFYLPDALRGYLDEEESRHAVKALRLAAGDPITLTDGNGNFYHALIKGADPRKCTFTIGQTIAIPRRSFSIHLAIAPTKNADRMEWLVEKCTEIGIEKISFIQCKTSERKTINTERLEKIAISAMKQSQQSWLPSLSGLIPFAEFIKECAEVQKFIAYVDETNPHHLQHRATAGSHYVVLVGPEGDFTAEELTQAQSGGYQKVSLGPHRLRTETAGMTSVITLNVLNQP